MAARVQIVNARIPETGIGNLRRLAEGLAVEEIAAPRVAQAFDRFLNSVAKTASSRFPYRKTGARKQMIRGSARVTGGSSFSSIRGYFYVDEAIATHEYGATIRARRTRYMAIPIADGLNANGTPKRTGPRAWANLKTFVWTNKKTGRKYIVYSRKRGTPYRLAFLYLLIPMVKVRATRTLRNEYDRQFPALYNQVVQILRSSMQQAYAKRVKAAEELLKIRNAAQATASRRNAASIVRAYVQANNISPQTTVKVPNADIYSDKLIPRY